MWCMEHEDSDSESMDDIADKNENADECHVGDDDHSEPDWRQFAAAYKGFQLNTTQELLTSNLFAIVKSFEE